MRPSSNQTMTSRSWVWLSAVTPPSHLFFFVTATVKVAISLGHINEVSRQQSRLLVGWVTVSQPAGGKLSRYITSHAGQLCRLVIRRWVGNNECHQKLGYEQATGQCTSPVSVISQCELVWLRANKIEISAALQALWLGRTCSTSSICCFSEVSCHVVYDALNSARASMPSWNCSAVLDGQLHANNRRHWSSTSVVCQSAEVSHATLSTEQFLSSTLCCCGPVDLEFAARQYSWPRTESWHFQTFAEDILFCEILTTKCIQRIGNFLECAPYKFILFSFAYLLPHSLNDRVIFSVVAIRALRVGSMPCVRLMRLHQCLQWGDQRKSAELPLVCFYPLWMKFVLIVIMWY